MKMTAKIMKTKFLWLLLAFNSAAFAATLNTTPSVPVLIPLQDQTQAAHLSAEILTHYHYRRIPLDDATSSKIFDNYLKELDVERIFFLQSDIDK
jgi:carboxyl-terminal processing protease